MATINEQNEFNDAFGEDTPAPAVQSEDDAFGLTLPGADSPAVEGSAAEEGSESASQEAAEGDGDGATPVVVAVVEEGGDGKNENDPSAQANADAANAQANEGASAADRGTSPAVQETGGHGKPAGASAEGTPAEEASETPAVEAAEQAAGMGDLDDMSDVPPEDVQKFKSWQGRLRKIEADLKSRSAQTATAGAADTPAEAALDQVADNAQASGDQTMAQAVDQASAAVEAGEMTAEQAMAQLADDFGPSFVKAIELAVKYIMGKEIGSVRQDTDAIISHLKDSAERAHFEAINAAHPDFVEVANDPRFKAYVAEQGKDAVVADGSAAAINQLLSDYKAATSKAAPSPASANGAAAPDASTSSDAAVADDSDAAPMAAAAPQVDQGAIDDAEGIRSGGAGGLRLPEHPKKGGDFVSSWDDF